MQFLIDTFQERFSDWILALGQHLQLSLAALLLAILLALPLGIFLHGKKRLEGLVLQLTGVFQTLPSLAILGLLIPIMGIGSAPAVTALVIYALFPILQNTITGLEQIDPNLLEAATAFGMTRWERLKKFEFALALPVIMSGIRTAAVMIIGTATLAALIGAGGLGSFILLGIDRNNSSLILIGALSSALLALVFHYGLGWLEKSSVKKIALSFLLLVLGLGISLAPNLVPKQGEKTLVVAGKLGPEPEILINMYKLLIEGNSDIKVEVKPNFGKTSFLYEALKSKDIDLYPEFTGTVVSSLLKPAPALSSDPQQVYEMAKKGLAQQDQLAFLKPMLYQNTYAIAVKRDFAQQHGLKTISDLAKVEKQALAGFTLEFNDREDGNQGLKSRYGLDLQVKTMEPALRYQAIAQGEIQITDAYSTDSELAQYDLVVLEDDKGLFPPYQGAPLLREETLKTYPELQGILEKLAGKITASQMSQLNYQVKVEGKSAASVAETYLKDQGILK